MTQEILAAHGLYTTHNVTCCGHVPEQGVVLKTAQPAQPALLQDLMRAFLQEIVNIWPWMRMSAEWMHAGMNE